MPTASDFDLAAEQFERAATDAARWADGARSHFGAETLSGGVLTAVCRQAVDAAEATAAATADQLTEKAALCRRRAAQVRAYESAFADYRTAHRAWRAALDDLVDGAAPGPAPRPPTKPTFAP